MVVDSRTSALGIVAKERSRSQNQEIVSASDFASPYQLLKFLSDAKAEQILFAWRGGLKEILIEKKSKKLFQCMLEVKTIHLLIPDLVGLDSRHILMEESLINATHGYWVTSEELYEKYQTTFPARKPLGIIHDLPNVDRILELRRRISERNGVIWVGNSQWGKNLGYSDHKGFSKIVTPLISDKERTLDFKIIDSAIRKVNNVEVLDMIAASKFLIQTSATEGTGLPLLEAMGLGTIPITTPVGVANEVLSGELHKLVVPQEVRSFKEKILQLEPYASRISEICMDSFDAYVIRAREEKIKWVAENVVPYASSVNFSEEILVRIKWVVRFIKNSRSPRL